ncbi:MAG TPA: SIR2 family protein [Longimicrobium sp.]|nr:SIR2 family protein [Longimicrobium sp.]
MSSMDPSAGSLLRADPTLLIAEQVAKERCILFLGAGVHFGPPDGSPFAYPEDQRPPTGGTLSRELAKACGFERQFPGESPGDLQRVSACYEHFHRSRKKLTDTVCAAVQRGRAPSPVLRALAELPFALVVTTNYDTLFETALRDLGKTPFVGVYSPAQDAIVDEPAEPTAASPFVIKLHGDVQDPSSLVITDEDYIRFVMRMGDKDPHNPVPETFRFYFKRWPTLFVGYSLRDYNLRLLFQTLRWKMDRADIPVTYSVDPRPDPLILAVLQDQRQYVTFLAEDAWEFVPRLYRRVTGKVMAAALAPKPEAEVAA